MGREGEREGEKHRCERYIDWLPLACPHLGSWHTTYVWAPTGNPSRDLSVCRPALDPLNHTSQSRFHNFLSFTFLICKLKEGTRTAWTPWITVYKYTELLCLWLECLPHSQTLTFPTVRHRGPVSPYLPTPTRFFWNDHIDYESRGLSAGSSHLSIVYCQAPACSGPGEY